MPNTHERIMGSYVDGDPTALRLFHPIAGSEGILGNVVRLWDPDDLEMHKHQKPVKASLGALVVGRIKKKAPAELLESTLV